MNDADIYQVAGKKRYWRYATAHLLRAKIYAGLQTTVFIPA
jgi:hypothetical protein